MPVIGCRCEVCASADRRDRRLRTSAMVETRGRRLLIDAGPDFRYQMLRAGVSRVDAILLTHDYPVGRPVDIYATPRTAACVRKDFDYAFVEDKYRGVPEIRLHEIDPSRPFTAGGVEITPIRGKHSERFDVTGYRIGPLAYMTDFKTLLQGEAEKLAGVDTLVVNALRFAPNDSHFDVEEAVALIREAKPRRAFLTHISHDMGLHALASLKLPEGVSLAYDTLEIEIDD